MDIAALIIAILALIALIVLTQFYFRLTDKKKALEEQLKSTSDAFAKHQERYKSVDDVEQERERVLAQLDQEKQEIESTLSRLQNERDASERSYEKERAYYKQQAEDVLAALKELREEQRTLEEAAELRTFSFYESRYSDVPSEIVKARLAEVVKRQKQMIKDKRAAVCHIEWTVGDSRRKGKKMTNDYIKLSLRAFNGECDAAVAKVSYRNFDVMKRRIDKSWEILNKLGTTTAVEITIDYLELKLEELRLMHEYRERVQIEKEEQRQIREQMREEERAQRELEKAKRDAEKEEARYEKALEKARREVAEASGAKEGKLRSTIEALEQRLAEAHANKERAISRAQMTRSGHVYIISNEGSFGEDVYKIGMTRRLDPMDRVRELGDASVPFRFDVHAIIYSEDAPTLENLLHKTFDERRVNMVNMRKEFFHVTIDEIANIVHEHNGEIEITKVAEAEEYRKTQALLCERTATQQEDLGPELAPALAELLTSA